MPKKILLISLSARSGHLRAAEAIQKTAQLYFPEMQVEHLDMADYCHSFLRLNIISSYNLLTHHLPKLYGRLYRFIDHAWQRKLLLFLLPLFDWTAKKLRDKIQEFQPDRIICTHLLPAYFIIFKIKTPIDILITDHCANQIWLAPKVKNFFAANAEVRQYLAKFNLPSMASGLPIDPVFYEQKDVRELKIKFGITNNLSVILIMPTCAGKINLTAAIPEILEKISSVNLIVIVGKEHSSKFKKLQQIQQNAKPRTVPMHIGTGARGRLQIIRHTNLVDEYLRIADIVVTKAGGLTIAECLALQKPMLIINPIPGQEEDNTHYLLKNNWGVWAKNQEELINFLQQFLNHQLSFSTPPLQPPAAKIILEKILE